MTLEDLISDIESGGNQYAMRFEPHVYERTQSSNRYEASVNAARGRNKCSRQTACMIVATSWGKFQIMGFNLYEPTGLDYSRSIGLYMANSEDQADTFKTFCQHKGIYLTPAELANPENALRFARTYNGADEYAKKIASRLTVA